MQNYRIKHEAKDHFILHDTRDGKDFKIAKKALSEKTYQNVKGLKMFADGGEEDTDTSDSTPSTAQPTFSEQDIQNSMAGSQPAPGSNSVSTLGTDPNAPVSDASSDKSNPLANPFATAPQDQNSTPLQDPNAAAPAMSSPMAAPAGTGQIAKGINEDAQAQSELGGKLSTIQGNSATELEANAKQYKTQVDNLNQKSLDLFNAAQNDKIDPNQYWTGDANGKGAHSKISAGIALFLGGIGGGASGKNIALDIINKNINDNIDAQKTNINNRRSLLNQNLAITGSVQAAASMTQSQLLTVTAAKVAQAQAQAIGPEAKGRADQLLGNLKMQIQQANARTALLQSQARIANGQGSQQDLNMADPKVQARAVKLPNGQVALANSDKEAEEVRDNLSSTENITQGLNRLDKLGPDAGIPGTQANKEAQSLVTSLKFEIANNQGIKRHSPELLDMIGKQFGDPSALKATLGMNGANRTQAFRQTLTDAQVANFKHKLVNYQAPFQPSTAKKGFK